MPRPAGSVPLIMTVGYALFALAPVFMVLVLVYAVRRVTDYAITRPCRDSLFTVVSREEKYQAKSLIDTFAYRGGDCAERFALQGAHRRFGAGRRRSAGWAREFRPSGPCWRSHWDAPFSSAVAAFEPTPRPRSTVPVSRPRRPRAARRRGR